MLKRMSSCLSLNPLEKNVVLPFEDIGLGKRP